MLPPAAATLNRGHGRYLLNDSVHNRAASFGPPVRDNKMRAVRTAENRPSGKTGAENRPGTPVSLSGTNYPLNTPQRLPGALSCEIRLS